jgi:AraC-like DNA-binding protein
VNPKPVAHAEAGAAPAFDAGSGSLLRVSNLRLPFRVRMVARRGQHLLSGERRRGVLTQGESIVVDGYRSVHYGGAMHVDPRIGHELHLVLHDDKPCAARGAPGSPAPPGLAARVAHAVYREPASDWSVAHTAERMQMSAQHLKTGLFREGSALTAIVREQRLMRALLALLAHPHARCNLDAIVGQFGFSSVAQLDDAFDRHFGMTASRVAKLAWYPALTWSVANPATRRARRAASGA